MLESRPSEHNTAIDKLVASWQFKDRFHPDQLLGYDNISSSVSLQYPYLSPPRLS